MVLGRPRIVRRLLSDGLRVNPETKVRRFDQLTPTGVTSTVSVKFIWPDEHVGIVHLDADRAQTLAAQLLMVAAQLKPELAG